ncbi:maltase 1-like isoform X2 [Gigantopelta aegis]|uniref:maltase 1-like isoform X2 n=1 Tax=Gigantopelta aegis TaxID=1735272 RepID=UPI001B887D40|nr:maltase 1-like isoform X2 [Gigantopelta aegis]
MPRHRGTRDMIRERTVTKTGDQKDTVQSSRRIMDEKKTPFCATKKCLLIVFVGLLIAMGIVTAITLLAPAVRGRFPPDLPWWKTSVIYQVYPRSFKASNGGKVGDIKGITSKLDHFVYLNVGVVWLSPVYESPMKDFGYDISNHTDVDPLFGTVQDLEDFIRQAHAKDIKVILDFVPNHTSDRHRWFQRSIDMDPKYKDYYVWRNGSNDPPNNWVSVFGDSAWNYSKTRDQYYYHNYLSAQPDLNYRNPDVVEDMKKLFHYWRHNYTMNLPDNKILIDGWRAVLDEFERKDGKTRFLLAEARVTSQAVRDWWFKTGSDMTFNFELARAVYKNKHCGGTCIRDAVEKEYKDLPEGAWPNFVLNNHDIRRVTSVRDRNFVNAFNMLLLTLWGTPTTYYGEEIGMVDIAPTFAQSVDPKGLYYGEDLYLNFTRDKSRSPMQWDDSSMAGFTTGPATWLPVSDTYTDINVQKQKNSTDMTPIKVYRTLAKLRQQESFLYGKFSYAVVNNNIFSYIRKAKGFSSYLVAINFGDVSSVDDYSGEPVSSEVGTVVVNTANFKDDTYAVKKVISLKHISLKPGEGLVIKL